MTIPRGLRVARAVAYAAGISAVAWLISLQGWDRLHSSDRAAVGLVFLVMSVPFTVIGAIFMAPYIRRPQLRWWIAYQVPLLFIVVLHVGFVLALGLDAPEFFFSSLLFEFPADIVGFSTLVAVFVASAPLIKSRRES